jgi:lycopene beta-cyclase
MSDFEAILVGGGLQNCLIALALLDLQPRARVALVERGAGLGGNHTWCFHAGDLDARMEQVVAPLVAHRWPAYDVAFPSLERRLHTEYAAVTSDRLAEVVQSRLADAGQHALLLGAEAVAVEAHRVVLRDGRRFGGRLVVDARGPITGSSGAPVAFQKFVGLELALARPSPRSIPLLMDARVSQIDGFRFVYVLPFAIDRVLIEDTYFSDHARLDRSAIERRVLGYAAQHGYAVERVVRAEHGILPLPFRQAAPRVARPLAAGYGGRWFHPTTGYSFPAAARLAAAIAEHPPEALFSTALPRLAREHARQARFACFLNRLLFSACAPADRVHVLERFYRLPEATVRRFYALTFTTADQARVICGRPPRGVSIRAALTRGALS